MVEYRYTLTRTWESGEGQVCWVCLNPGSKPDHINSPTRTAIIHFSQKAGFRELILVNLYAAKTPYSRLLYKIDYPKGVDNDWFVEQAIKASDEVVFAWGGFSFEGAAEPPSDAEGFARRWKKEPWCLGRTLSGAPRHPLYADKRSILQPY
jgi:hypothetical protein